MSGVPAFVAAGTWTLVALSAATLVTTGASVAVHVARPSAERDRISDRLLDVAAGFALPLVLLCLLVVAGELLGWIAYGGVS